MTARTTPPAIPVKTQPKRNRRDALLHAAAVHFLENGFAASSMRHIAAAANMKPGSIYYHFESKSMLFIEVHKVGLIHIKEQLEAALEGVEGGWKRLEVACTTHLKVLLEGDLFYQAVMSATPRQYGKDERLKLAVFRDAYEVIFSKLLDDLDLPVGTDRHDLRLMLLGAMNWTFNWYQPGRETPEELGRKYVKFLEQQLRKVND